MPLVVICIALTSIGICLVSLVDDEARLELVILFCILAFMLDFYCLIPVMRLGWEHIALIVSASVMALSIEGKCRHPARKGNIRCR